MVVSIWISNSVVAQSAGIRASENGENAETSFVGEIRDGELNFYNVDGKYFDLYKYNFEHGF